MSVESVDGLAVTVTIEIPRWSFVKYAVTEQGGRVDFVSPLPCPFNYGFVAGTLGGDQQPFDAIIFGPRLRRAEKVRMPVRAVARFVDNGEVDDKLVCSASQLAPWNIALLRVGLVVYGGMKRVVNFCRGRHGATSFKGIDFDVQSFVALAKSDQGAVDE